MPADDPKTIVTDLNAGWYNAVTKAMNITNPKFQLAQGTLGLQTADSSGLFLMSDSVPQPAAVAYYDPSGLSKRSSAYRLLLAALLPETGTDLSRVLGDMYPAWIDHKLKYYTTPPTPLPKPKEVFTNWANQTLEPRKAQQAINTFLQAENCPLNRALIAMSEPASMQQFVDTAQRPYILYKYSATADAATAAINTGGSANIQFDSKSMDTTLKSTFVQGAASGFYKFFSDGASGSFDQLNTTAAKQRFKVTGTINKYATLTVNPVNWFDSGEFGRAYNARNDYNIWDAHATAGNWDSFFANPNGTLVSRVSQLLLVSDYTIIVTSSAKYRQEDVQEMNAKTGFSIWPFFSASGSSTNLTECTLNDQSELVVKQTLNKGLIQIWGVFVEDAPK